MSGDEAQKVRRQHIGASEIAAVFGLDPYKSDYALWVHKTGRLDGLGLDDSNDATDWGHRMEDPLATWFADHNPDWEVLPAPGSLVRDDHPLFIVSPDRIIRHRETGVLGVLELKNAGDRQRDQWLTEEDQAPERYIIQTLMQMWATGTTTGYLCVLLNGNHPVIRRVDWDAEAVDTILTEVEAWWDRHVIGGSPPAPDESDRTTHLLEAMYGTTIPEPIDVGADAEVHRASIKAMRDQIKVLADAIDRSKNLLRSLMGEHDEAVSQGNVIATWKQTGPFSRTRFAADNPEAAEKCTELVPVINAEKAKQEYPEEYAAARGRVLLIKDNPKPPKARPTTTPTMED
jgi:putative phage-type endonuclease